MFLALLSDRVGQGKFLVLHSVKKNPGAKASGFFLWERLRVETERLHSEASGFLRGDVWLKAARLLRLD